jgi:hypothetical protein
VDGYFWGWIRHYEIWGGIVVSAERALQRYANIDASAPLDADTVIEMKHQLPSQGKLAVGFATRSLLAEIEKHAYNKTNMSYSLRDIEGFGPVVQISGIYVRPWESISENESQVA